MKFKEINNYSYIKYVVYIESTITKRQTIKKDEKTFNKIDEVISYIKDLKNDMTKYPELYTNSKIIMNKIITKSNTYEILEGE